MNEKWTPQQLKAIFTRDKHILVSASAGSGKTSVMTQRVLSLIEEGCTLDQMLIVTFTRAAAADMKEKLATKILRSQSKRVRQQLDLLATADICTLHSFCQRLVSTYFYAVGVDPEFVVLEDSKPLVDLSIEAAIREFCAHPSDDFAQLNEIFTDARTDYRLKSLVECDMYSKQTGQVEQVQANPLQQLNQLLDARLNRLVEKIERLKCLTEQAGFRRNIDYLGQFEGCLRAKYVPPMPRGRIEPQFIDLNEQLKGLREQACALVDDYERVQNAKEQSTQLLQALAQLSARAQEIYRGQKAEKSRLDFNDLEECALKIIGSQMGRQIRAKYKYIFVDEYQDINPLQDRLIESLVHDNYLFLVGDIKQSIYAFRGCEPDIFLRKRQQFLTDDNKIVVELNKNHRSKDEILQFCNRLFGAVMTKDLGGVDYASDAQFVVCGNGGGSVKIHCTYAEDDPVEMFYRAEEEKIYDITRHKKSDDHQSQQIAACVADILAHKSVVKEGKSRPVLYKDIAILCRSIGHTAHAVYDRLNRLNIPVCLSAMQQGSGIYTAALTNYLRLISNPYDDEALINGLKSYFGGFSDDDLARIRLDFPNAEYFYQAALAHKSTQEFFDRLAHYRQMSAKISVGRLCGAIVSDFEYFQYLFVKGENAALQLERFLQQAEQFEGCLYDFLGEYADASPSEGESDAVSIMTIHASKGLEFPFVILIDVHKRFNLKELSSPILIHKGCSAIKHYDLQNKCECDSPQWLLNYFCMQKRRREEELRLLYVALTRAQYSLDIFFAEEFKQPDEFCDYWATSSFLGWISPLYPAYCAKELYAPTEREDVPKRVAPPPNEKLVLALKQRFFDGKALSTPLTKTYVTALVEQQQEQQDAKQLFNDDRALQRGVAYHKVMELIDFNAEFSTSGIDQSILAQIDIKSVRKCFYTIKKLIDGRRHYKEKGFLLSEGNTLIQGVIDLMIIDNDSAIIVDYKTGKIHTNYSQQLAYYGAAAERILGIKIKRRLIYSFLSHELMDV